MLNEMFWLQHETNVIKFATNTLYISIVNAIKHTWKTHQHSEVSASKNVTIFSDNLPLQNSAEHCNGTQDMPLHLIRAIQL